MSGRHRPLIDKPLGLRISELALATRLIEDSVKEIIRGEAHYYLPLSASLRMMLTDKAKHAAPLLVDLARILGVDTTVYPGHYLASADLPDDLPEGRSGAVPKLRRFVPSSFAK